MLQQHLCAKLLCNIPLWRTETTYSLRTLARKWSGPFLMLDLIYLIMMWLTDDWCVTIHVYGCYWLSWLSVQVCDLEDAEASVDPLGLRTESGSVLLGWFVYYDVDLMWWFDDDILTWLLVMQADDSLPTWLTYGVKGPHTIAERLRERGGQQPCHRLLALPPWLEL